MVKNITISVSDETAEKMSEFPEVNWSEVCRQAIDSYIKNRKIISEIPETGLTFDDFLKETGIEPPVFKAYSEFMKKRLRDTIYPRWYYSRVPKIDKKTRDKIKII